MVTVEKPLAVLQVYTRSRGTCDGHDRPCIFFALLAVFRAYLLCRHLLFYSLGPSLPKFHSIFLYLPVLICFSFLSFLSLPLSLPLPLSPPLPLADSVSFCLSLSRSLPPSVDLPVSPFSPVPCPCIYIYSSLRYLSLLLTSC